MSAIRREKDKLYLSYYAQPNAKADKIVGLFQDHIKVQIAAPATENKANQHLRKWIAKEFQTPLSKVELIKGELSRYKVICIDGPRQEPSWLSSFEI